jgi:Secretin and TonB N terminus short domain
MKFGWREQVVKSRVKDTVIVFFLLTLGKSLTAAQEIPPLERTVTVSFTNERVADVLKKLEEAGSFIFSYNPAILDGDRSVTTTFTNQSVREVLNSLFAGSLHYKVKGNYIILMRAPKPPQETSVERSMIISGYVVNGDTGEKLPDVSVYDKKSLTGVISSEFGYFKLKLDRGEERYTISFNKKSFLDTFMTVNRNDDQLMTMVMYPEKKIVADLRSGSDITPDSVPVSKDATTLGHRPQGKESQVNMENIRDTLYNDVQVSLLPFIGTNQRLSGNVISDYSFNILGGYIFGVNQLEIGGIFNVDRGNVQHVQLAGLVNAVGGNIEGVQAAGAVNVNRGSHQGAQFGGLLNVNLYRVKGPQFAGVMNINGSASQGAQFAGIGNVQVMDYRGSQFAGIFNIATDHIAGAQISGILNFGRTVKGSQIGLINISDSIHGVPIGLLSLVGKGYHKIELSGDEIFHVNLAFRTGMHQFYNIVTVGARADNFKDPLWNMGYGFGTSPRLAKWLYVNFDLTASHVSRGHLNRNLSLLNKVYMGFDFQISKKFSVTAGATLNGYLTHNDENFTDIFSDFHPHFVYDEDIAKRSHLQIWWGGKIGVRFL